LWHFWFFGSLMIIYLFLPVFHRMFFEKKNLHRAACLVFMGICFCMSELSMIKGYPLSMFVPQPLRLWTWVFYFLAGGLFAAENCTEYIHYSGGNNCGSFFLDGTYACIFVCWLCDVKNYGCQGADQALSV